MPKIFRNRSGDAGDGDDNEVTHHDDMTINSGWSRGGASVSNRIMDRMKLNLSSGDSARSMDAASIGASVGSRSRKSTGAGRFGRRLMDARNMRSAFSVDGGGRSSSRLRGHSSRKYKSSDLSSVGSSTVSVNAMEEMDSTEAMALKGQTFGRRRTSTRKLNGSKQKKVVEPVEYSLAELRSMDEFELGDVMRRAGVSYKDISSTLEEAEKSHTKGGSITKDQRKNALVAFFVNSGRVKLVAKKSDAKESDAKKSDTKKAFAIKSDAKKVDVKQLQQIVPTLKSDSARKKSPLPAESFESSSVMSSNTKNETRKSKLEKIAELKIENSKVKKENKSLKKSLKKLVDQLKRATNEKDELKKTLGEETEQRKQQEAHNNSLQSSLQSIKESNDAESDFKKSQDAENSEIPSERQPPFDVVTRNYREKPGKQSKLDNSGHSITSDRSTTSRINYYKRKYNVEKEAHINTDVRLKAEVEILAKEVEGLQRQLSISLQNLDDTKKRTRQSRESASSLKRELRNSSIKVDQLAAEAEARDKLIATFSQILLQKVGVEEGGGGSGLSMGERLEQEEKLGDRMIMGQTKDSSGPRELPTKDIVGDILKGV